mmetsp:Transcript_14354/g.29707  ORF Transcript_14354/g.29707 Transcript_14354/m.29707 type:complete len:252 (+) Transcript_14354:589-1344(+)
MFFRLQLTTDFWRLVLLCLTPQIDGLSVLWRDKELWLRSLFVLFVNNRTPGCFLEGVLDGFRCLGRSLEMGEWLRSGDGSCRGRPAPFLGLFAGYQAIVGLIDFVAHHHKRKLRRGVTQSLDSTADLVQKLFSPVIQIVQRVGIRHVVHQQAGIRTPIKSHAQRLKALLSGRVPNLGLDLSLRCVEHLRIKLDSHCCGNVVVQRSVGIRQSSYQGGLSDARVSEHDDLVQRGLSARCGCGSGHCASNSSTC